MTKKLLDYFAGDELAASTWENKYALRDDMGELLEQTPEDMHRRLAREFWRVEKDFIDQAILDRSRLSEYGQKRSDLSEEKIYELFDKFRYIVPAGSVMAGAGSKKPVSLSNCFVLPTMPKDSYSSIMFSRLEMVQLEKRRGGTGVDLSNLRPRGAFVNNAAKTSTGAASFMEGFSAINNEVAQQGRRGALMITISIAHPDSPEFIEIKQDLTKVTGANVSVKIPDDFMKAVEKDEDYLLHWPVQGDHVPIKEVEMEYNILYPSQYVTPDGKTGRGYIKKIRAKELWDTLIHCAWNTAEPGILFETTLHDYAPDGVYPKFKMISTNPCQPLWATVISRNKGLTTLGEVGIGEEIWSSEGWTRIVNKQYTGKKDVYSIRTSGGVFYGTENHRVVSDGKKIEAGLCDSIDSLSGEVFNRESPIDPTIVMDGLVLGDGEVHKASNNLVLLDIGKDDYDYFESEIASLIGKHRPGIHEYSYEVITNIRPEELISKTAIEIPKRYMSGEKDRICDFLRGLYSANGSVVNNRITLKTASPKLRDQVQLLLSYLGIDSYYTTNKEKSVEFSNGAYTCNESYDINISTDRDKFVANIGFIQKYKNDKIDLNLSRSGRSKERLVVCKEYISTEDVFDITVNNSSHTYWTGGLNVSNCGEIPMGNGDSCRLIHVNLSSFVRNPYLPDATVDYDKLYSVFYEATRLGDDLVSLEEEALEKIMAMIEKDDSEYGVWDRILTTAKKARRSGVGFFGLSDMIAMLGLKFCSPESIEVTDRVCNMMMKAELDSDIDMAIERGMFPSWNKTYETADANKWYKFISSTYPEQWERMQEHGRRNISFSTVAPTGTVAMVARASSGIEPVFMPFYMRRRKCNSDLERVDFIDKMGIKFQEFIVVHPGLEEWAKINYPGEVVVNWKLDKWQEVFEKSPWYGSTSPEIDWEKRVELQGVVQKYITHAISSTVNLPNNVTEDEVSKIYLTAWKTGNKGQTIYRDGSRDGILVKAEEKRRDDKFRSYVEAPKRPKVLPADFYTTKVKGELFYVMVGLYLDKPYEIFVFKPDLKENEKPPKQHRGEITKIKRGVYTFKSDLITIENISKDLSPIEYTVVLFSSMLLRTGANIKYVIKTAQKAKDGINGFTSALVRILSKYSPDELLKGETCPECGGTLVRESGCIMCKDCGYSKCL